MDYHCSWTSNFDDSVFGDNTFGGGDQSQADPFSSTGNNSRYAGLDFHEDPFKNSNYRYADPFAENSDPFGAPDSQVFGSDPFNNSNTAAAADPFKSDSSDPFGAASASENNYENSKALEGADPFGNSFTASFNTSAPNKDPFGSSSFGANFGSSGNDPFSLTNLKSATSAEASTKFSSASAVSTTNNTVSYRKEKLPSDSSSIGDKSVKKKSSHSFSDFLTGSPMKLEKSDKKDKEKKKSGKFHLPSPLKNHKKESPTADKKHKTTHNEADEVIDKSPVTWNNNLHV